MNAALLPLPGTKPIDIPYDQRAEESVLGHFLYFPQSFAKARKHLDADSFFSPGAAKVFKILCDLDDDGEPITLEAVCWRIEKIDFFTLADALAFCALSRGGFLRDFGTVLIHSDARHGAQEAAP